MAQIPHPLTAPSRDLIGHDGIRAVALVEAGPPPVVVVVSRRPQRQKDSRAWLSKLGTPSKSRKLRRGDREGWLVDYVEHGEVALLVDKEPTPTAVDALADPEGLFDTPVSPPASGAVAPTAWSGVWYDRVHTPDLPDVQFYVDLAKASAGPVLELGIGTGRVALPTARTGKDVVGIDASAEMLACLEAKVAAEPALAPRIQAFRADMRTFDLERTFPLVTIPFRGFLHNLTSDDQLSCLAACRRHLEPGGQLVFNVFHPSLDFMSANTGPHEGTWRWVRDHELPEGGWVTLSQAVRYDTVAQHIHARQRLERYGTDGVLIDAFMFRIQLAYLYVGDLTHLLTTAGFEDITIEGGFEGGPLRRDGDELVIRARL